MSEFHRRCAAEPFRQTYFAFLDVDTSQQKKKKKKKIKKKKQKKKKKLRHQRCRELPMETEQLSLLHQRWRKGSTVDLSSLAARASASAFFFVSEYALIPAAASFERLPGWEQ